MLRGSCDPRCQGLSRPSICRDPHVVSPESPSLPCDPSTRGLRPNDLRRELDVGTDSSGAGDLGQVDRIDFGVGARRHEVAAKVCLIITPEAVHARHLFGLAVGDVANQHPESLRRVDITSELVPSNHLPLFDAARPWEGRKGKDIGSRAGTQSPWRHRTERRSRP